MARCVTAILAAASLLALAAPGQAQQERAQKLQGTWVRKDVGCKVKLEVKPASLRCTVTMEEGVAMTVDADYVVSKDGILVGILRAPMDPNPADTDAVNRRLFYFQFTAEDRSLTVKDLRYKDSQDGDKMKELLQGKYHKAEAKHARAEAKGSMTLPSAHYLQHPPAYCPPSIEPSPAKRKNEPKGNEAERRTSELLKESEDLRKIEQEWERVWFTDEPSHMTPERVHGGVEECCPTDWRSVLEFFTVSIPAGFNWVGR
jgi:hypothetical protein